jgi:predicted chitinase
MWDTFRFQVKAVMEAGPGSLDDVAKVIAKSYDSTIKLLPAGDILFKNPVENGNTELLENIIKMVLTRQQSSPEQLPIINGIANGFVAYWSTATLQKMFVPLIPAPGAIANVAITQNMTTFPGIQVAIPFTYEGLDNVDGFLNKIILAANIHLSTLQGMVMTTSTYPPGVTAPGFIPWSGFAVDGNPNNFGELYANLMADNQDYVNMLKQKFGDSIVDPAEIAAKLQAAADLLKASAPPPGSDLNSVGGGDVQSNLDAIETACIKAGITNPKIILAIKANCMKETGGTILVEDMSGYARTSNERIRSIFGSRVSKYDDAGLNALKSNVTAFADAMYGVNSGKMGKNLGNDQPGDGYKYRGRGFVQLTGKYAYREASKGMFGDERLVTNPDLLNTQDVAAASAVWEVKKSLNLFSKKLNLNPNDPNISQDSANKLITSIIAGTVVNRGGTGYLSTLLAKVDGYSQKIPLSKNISA